MYFDESKHIKFNAPLHPQDTPFQTFGCRANNPEICPNGFIQKCCAFCRADGICTAPSNAWKRQFKKLSEQKNRV